MFLLFALSSHAASVTVLDGKSIAEACNEAVDTDVITIDAGRKLQGNAEDDCVLNLVTGVTLQGNGSGAVMGSLESYYADGLLVDSLGVGPSDFDSLGSTLTVWFSDGVELRDVELLGIGETGYGVYFFDSNNVVIDGLSGSSLGRPDDAALIWGGQESAGALAGQLDDVVLQGPGARVYVGATSGSSLLMSGLVLQDGQGDFEAGGCFYQGGTKGGASVIMDEPQISGCYADFGGAVHLDEGLLLVKGGRVHQNEAWFGGAFDVAALGELSLQDGVMVDQNVASDGSAVYVESGRLSMVDANIEANVSVFLDGDPPTGGAVTAVEPKKLILQEVVFCGNSVDSPDEPMGSALSVFGSGGTSDKPSLSYSELRDNSGAQAVLFLEDHQATTIQNNSFVGNDASTLVDIGPGGAVLLDSNLLMDAKVGHPFSGTLGTGYNYWYQVDEPAPNGSANAQDIDDGVDPGLVAGYNPAKCGLPLTLDKGSPLIDAGNPSKSLDPDGTTRDIGANPTEQIPDTGDTGETGDSGGETGDSGGETGETGDSAPVETGEPELPVVELPITLSGGCGQSGGTSGAASFLLGLALLGLRRRNRRP